MGEGEMYRNWCGNPEVNRSIGRIRRKCKETIKCIFEL
jgi:hypothetical protein